MGKVWTTHMWLKANWSHLKWLYSKGLPKGSRIPTERVCEIWTPETQIPVKCRREMPTNEWGDEEMVWRALRGTETPWQGKEKGQLWHLPNQRAVMAAHKYKPCSSVPVPSPLLPSPSWTLESSETVQVNNCEEVERQIGKVEEYLSKPYFILQACLLLHSWLAECRSFNFEWSLKFLLLL